MLCSNQLSYVAITKNCPIKKHIIKHLDPKGIAKLSHCTICDSVIA